jgi:glycosyltransferase involved in cell wall biosynthesis
VSERRIQIGDPVGGSAGVVVCVLVRRHDEALLTCLERLLAHTPADVPILVYEAVAADAEGPPEGPPEVYDPHGQLLHATGGGALAPDVNTALAMAGRADVVLLHSGCLVATGWLEGLRGAAGDSRVASVTALADSDAIRRHGPDSLDFDQAAATVRAGSLAVRPELAALAGDCIYLRRSALDLAGPLDAVFVPGGEPEVRFSRACARLGLRRLLADDVLVTNVERAPAPPVSEHRLDELSRSLGHLRQLFGGLSVVLDARALAGPMNGTKLHNLALSEALAANDGVKLRILLPHEPNRDALAYLERIGPLAFMSPFEAVSSSPADIAHRPSQVTSLGDLTLLSALGDRVLITQQDLIAYHNASYFRDRHSWEGHRRLTRVTLSLVDHAVFFSQHALRDARRDDLIDPARASVVPIGVDHSWRIAATGVMPDGLAALAADTQVIACIGTDYHHKNRVFALRLLAELQQRHDWYGALVLAGQSMPNGSSRAEEDALLAGDPRAAGAVIRLGALSEAEKAWLLERASLVLYPSIDEGFGLVPFEAAASGLPCMWSPGGALTEVLPLATPGITPWDPARSADHAIGLLRDPTARAAAVADVQAATQDLTWERTAAHLVELYRQVSAASPTPASLVERRYGLASGGLSEDALRLVGPDGALPAELERPLLALATHPAVSRPLFKAISSGYRAGYRLRRLWRG